MNTHILILSTLIALAVTSFGQTTPNDILSDYNQKAASALKRIDDTLAGQVVAIASALVSRGDSAGANEVSEQLKQKTNGEAVLKPHSSVAILFKQYDAARAAALGPIQQASIAKIEAILKTTAGKDLETVVELGNVRQEIEAGKPNVPVMPAESWSYHTSPSGRKMGSLELRPDGTFDLLIPTAKSPKESGSWKPTKKPNILDLSCRDEKWEVVLNGADATIERPLIGIRFLKAQSTDAP